MVTVQADQPVDINPSQSPSPRENRLDEKSEVAGPVPTTANVNGDESAHDDRNVASKKSLAFYLGFLAVNINALVFSVDATSLAVAIPIITKQLNGTALEAFWANISYMLCVAVTQPLYTTTSDTFGRKPLLYVAFVFFIVGSLVFALAQNMPTVIAGRVLQGLGGGGLDVLGEIIVADITTLQERSLYLGIMALPITLGTILGPAIGALFTTYVSWRWIGWINLPLLGVSLILVFFFLRTRPIDISLLAAIKNMDWGGILLSVTGITAFVVPVSWAGALYPWESWKTIVPLVIGVALLVALGFYERRPVAPVFPPRLLRSHTAKWTLLANFLHGAVVFTVIQYLPLLFQSVGLETTIESAVTLMPTSIASVIAAVGAMVLVGVFGKGYVWMIRAFWIELSLGTGILVLIDQYSPRSLLFGLPIVWSIGVGALMRLLHLPMQASVPSVDDTGHAIGLMLTFRILGGLVGLAIGSTLFNNVFAASISRVANLPDALATLRDGSEAIAFIPYLGELDIPIEVLKPVLGAYVDATRAILYAMTAFSVVGFVTSIFTKEHSLQKTDLGRQRFDDEETDPS